MRTISYWLSLLMIFTVPFATIIEIPGLGTMSRFTGFLAAGFWLLTVLVTGKFRKFGPFHILIFLFFLWNAVASIWSVDLDGALSRTFTYAQMAILSLIIWDVYDSPAAIKAGFQAYVLGLAVPIGSTIASYLASRQTEFATYGRYSAAGSDYNTTAILLATGIPLAWYLTAAAREGRFAKLQRVVNYAYIPLITFAMILTATRFAFLMAVPSFIFGLSTLTRVKTRYRVLIFVLLSVAIVSLGSKIPTANLQRLGTIDDELSSGDLNERAELWSLGIGFWLDHPIIGIGTAGYEKAVEPIYGRTRAVHNSFIAVLAELGTIGFLLFGVILANAVYLAWRFPNKLETWFWLTALCSWTLGNLALTWIYSKPTWIMLTLLATSAAQVHQAHQSTQNIPVIKQIWDHVGTSTTLEPQAP